VEGVRRVSGQAQLDVRSPYSGDVVGHAPLASTADVDAALDRAVEGARAMAALPAYERADALCRAADAIDADAAALADLITAEQGKQRAEAAAEASRIGLIIRLCAEEGRRLDGDVLPMDAVPLGVGRFGFTLPQPTGIVVAISPFNYPAILVIHKLAPALAAGNAVILKPALATPLTALFIVARLAAAGLPPHALQCVVGPGAAIGQALCEDRRVRKISFTGSYATGAAISRAAGPKRLTCELGSNAALVVLPDADLEHAAAAIAHSGYTNAGQNCVSTQRVLVHRERLDELLDGVLARVDALVTGDPADRRTTLGPVIDEREADRVTTWLARDARDARALLRGGEREGAVVGPAVMLEPERSTRIWRDEYFGPAIGVRTFGSDDEALAMANDTRYGLAACVMTRDVDRALRFAGGLRTGIVNINSPAGSTWRADLMPWGGFGDSGFGKEGARDAVRDMTEDKLVVIHPGHAG
jgi:glyceraldehyde-3-phosphate dehydrogenase (NADP+)